MASRRSLHDGEGRNPVATHPNQTETTRSPSPLPTFQRVYRCPIPTPPSQRIQRHKQMADACGNLRYLRACVRVDPRDQSLQENAKTPFTHTQPLLPPVPVPMSPSEAIVGRKGPSHPVKNPPIPPPNLPHALLARVQPPKTAGWVHQK
jgi:hypothetical protein